MPKLLSSVRSSADTDPTRTGASEGRDALETTPITTMVLFGVPSRMKLGALFGILESLGFAGDAFDLFYMPMRSNYGTNYGFVFINCATARVAAELGVKLHHHPLGRGTAPAPKVYCEPSTSQGLAANLARLACERKTGAIIREGREWRAI